LAEVVEAEVEIPYRLQVVALVGAFIMVYLQMSAEWVPVGKDLEEVLQVMIVMEFIVPLEVVVQAEEV
jgi:hypothetical protein